MQSSQSKKTIPVLIVGAGPVGLSTALALARQNVHSIVIESHPGLTDHPRARGVNVRTMELFRQWGNISELLKHEQPKEARRFIWAQSLQGKEVTRVSVDDVDSHLYSSEQSSLVSQDYVEDSLYKTLLNYSHAVIQFSKELITFDQNDEYVNVRVLNRETQQEEMIQAQYVVAADGAHSRIRKQLSIEMEGPDNLGQFCSVYCEFDISQLTQHRPCIGYFFTDPAIAGRSLFSIDGKKRWIVGMRFIPGNSKNDFTDEYCISEIRRVLSLSELDIHIINKNFWTMAAQVATEYRKGRIFLVGDAAHRLPPTGGFGMNTGIQDAHNLAWKLAFVLQHNVADEILNSYFTERAPIAKQNIAWSMENAKRYGEINEAIRSGDKEKLIHKLKDQQKNLNNRGLDLGFIYHSDLIESENSETISVSPGEYKPTTLPGSRAPYVRIIKDGKEISMLDLFEKEYVLLLGAEGDAWREVAKDFAFPLKIYRIAVDGDLIDPENHWHDKYEVTQKGAVLVRPDGHIAKRFN